jgi:hypothetical protein
VHDVHEPHDRVAAADDDLLRPVRGDPLGPDLGPGVHAPEVGVVGRLAGIVKNSTTGVIVPVSAAVAAPVTVTGVVRLAVVE